MTQVHKTNKSLLPRKAPLSMPEQHFNRRLKPASKPRLYVPWPLNRATAIPRAAILLSSALLTFAFAHQLHAVLSTTNITPLQIAFLVMSTLAFGWIALGTMSSALGFIHLIYGNTPETIKLPLTRAPLKTRTALLFPIFKENPSDIAGTIEALCEHLEETGQQSHFDVFVLSDTPDAEQQQSGGRELTTFAALNQKLSARLNVYYRRRTQNTARKSGNIKDWVECFGARYQNFIILDADSVMSGPTLVSLAQAMEETPSAGLIQTVPKLAGAQTLFQKLQQFANNVYGPASAAGLAAWHGDEGNYWGHNAIIRTHAFAGAAGLPVLKGQAPFGGHIQSHDFVEAALMARAGWAIHMVPTTQGTFEASPPTLPDLIARDRRWAQGNLQHLSILKTRGLTAMGRTHLVFGAASYIVALAWAASLLLGILLALQGSQMIPSYFTDKKTLFPIWPITDPGQSLQLFVATLGIILTPKAMGALLEIRRAKLARETGATSRAIAGVATETVFSMLIAPILMITQTVAVFEIFSGRDSGWMAQTRADAKLTLANSMAVFALPTLIGLAMTATCVWVSVELTAWMSPILLGTVLAGPLAWFTARRSTGFLKTVLATPEDRTQPAILDHTDQFQRSWAARLDQMTGTKDQKAEHPIARAA